MITVHDTRLDQLPNLRITGQPVFNTTALFARFSGRDFVNLNDEYALWEYTVQFVRKKTGFDPLLQFWYGRRGRTYAFLFKDLLSNDYADGGLGSVKLVGGVLRLVKTYSDPVLPYQRLIQRPRSGTVTLAGGGTVDYSTGIVTGGTANTAATFQFDIPVRFTSEFAFQRDPAGVIIASEITMREVRI